MDENRGDQPLSSEELLRRAREGLGDADSTPEPPPDFQVESYPPPLAEPTPPPMADVPEIPTSFDEPLPTSPFEPDAPFEATPSSDPSSWAPPPPIDNDGGSDWTATAPGPAPAPVKGGRRSLFSKAWILVVLVIGGFALFSFLDGSKTVDDIAVGDCMNIPDEDVFFEIDPIDCAEAHELEVFALVDLGTLPSDITLGVDFSLTAAYPGDEAVSAAAFNACYDRFESYVGMIWDDSVLEMDVFTPTFEGWTEVDDRIANCLVFEVDATRTSIVMSTGSLRGVGR